MGYKTVTQGDTTKLNTPDMIDSPMEGHYLKTDMVDSNFGECAIHKFKGDKEPFAVWGFTMLNRAMEGVLEGQKCRITYKGTKNVKTKFGMKDVHQVLVEVDEDECFDVNAPSLDDEPKIEPF